MTKIYAVQVQTHEPGGPGLMRFGAVAEGRYIIEDDTVIMTDANGIPAVDPDGRRYTHKLQPGEFHKTIAARLTKQLRGAMRELGGRVNGFDGRPIDYPPLGIA